MGRTDFLLELIRSRNGAAITSLVALVIAGRILGNRRSTWLPATAPWKSSTPGSFG
jgi:hypothetical protein